MRLWRHLLGGLLLWTAHFFAVYGIASIFPGTREAAVFVLIVTAVALTVAALLFVGIVKKTRRENDQLLRWIGGAAALGYALAGAAIIYQGLPAFFA